MKVLIKVQLAGNNLGKDLGFALSRNFTLIHNNTSKHTLTTYHTLDKLITALTKEERTEYNRIIRNIQFPSTVFEKISSWCNESYTRNCIAESEKFELILLCWKPGQKTPIHDHGGEECWVKIIEGAFKETIYATDAAGELNSLRTSVLKTNEISYMIDFMGFHCLENVSNKRSMSLHLYAKPIRSCNIFDVSSGKFLNKELTYSTIAEEVMV